MSHKRHDTARQRLARNLGLISEHGLAPELGRPYKTKTRQDPRIGDRVQGVGPLKGCNGQVIDLLPPSVRAPWDGPQVLILKDGGGFKKTGMAVFWIRFSYKAWFEAYGDSK